MVLDDIEFNGVGAAISDARENYGDVLFFGSLILGPFGPMLLIAMTMMGV